MIATNTCASEPRAVDLNDP
ncbi:unnamed protein product, partial [Didymodactylos carnosus]